MICVWVRARIWLLDSPYLKLIGPAVAEIFRIQDAVGKNSQAESELKWGSACIFTLKCCLSSLPFFLFVKIFDRKAAQQLIWPRLFLCKFWVISCFVCLKFASKSTKFWVRDKIWQISLSSSRIRPRVVKISSWIVARYSKKNPLQTAQQTRTDVSLSRLYH